MPKLALYQTDYCGYCSLVVRVIERLGVEVEMRDTLADRAALEELVNARGRRTVPVLRIEGDDGEVEWLPESRDIVRYLEALVAGGQAG